MGLIVIDGPRGVGKTKMIETLRASLPVHYVWSWEVLNRARNTSKFSAILRDTLNAINDGRLVIIENSWSHSSMAKQFEKPRAGRDMSAEFLAEWQFGRLVQLCGVRVMMLAPSLLLAEHNGQSERDAKIERAIFHNYAVRWNWLAVAHEYTTASFGRAAHYLMRHVPRAPFTLEEYPGYCGPRYAPIVFVGSADREELDVCSGKHLPFSGEQGTILGSYFAQASINIGWATARRIPPVVLRSAKILVATDEQAESWCWHNVGARDVRRLPDLRRIVASIKRSERVEVLDTLASELQRLQTGG